MLDLKKYLPFYYYILNKKYVVNLRAENVYVHDTPLYLEKCTGKIAIFDEDKREMVFCKYQGRYCIIKNGKILTKA